MGETYDIMTCGCAPDGATGVKFCLLHAAAPRLVEALRNAATEMDNIHREYLAGQHGGCPCCGGQFVCPLGSVIDEARALLAELGEEG